MSAAPDSPAITAAAAGGSWRDYLELTKPKVSLLIVFTAIVGMVLASPGMVPLNALLFGTLGIALASGSAAAFNHILDQRIDIQMARTRHRPLPTGQLDQRHALAFAAMLGMLSMLVLALGVNALTAVLTFGSLIGYAVIYTQWLKRATPQNIVIGGAAGAAPPVLGWAAVTNSIDPHALLLFLIVFTWTPPHFWALAIARRDEYAKVGIPMLPVTHGIAYTRLVPNANAAPAVVQPPFLVLQFISGVFVRYNEVPGWLRTVASVFPLRWMSEGLRYAFLPDEFGKFEYGDSWGWQWPLAVLSAWLVVGFLLALVFFRWDREGS